MSVRAVADVIRSVRFVVDVHIRSVHFIGFALMVGRVVASRTGRPELGHQNTDYVDEEESVGQHRQANRT
jgi:hypothetical protein